MVKVEVKCFICGRDEEIELKEGESLKEGVKRKGWEEIGVVLEDVEEYGFVCDDCMRRMGIKGEG
ncbi:MAG: hypothetical protein DRP27_05310 [Thermotogae bacterium]|nr:MAG: hypothetical protein DRP27_05310 [Thermotogota bacterium]